MGSAVIRLKLEPITTDLASKPTHHILQAMSKRGGPLNSGLWWSHLVHIRAVGPVAHHAVRAGPALHPLGGLHALHPRVAGVGHTGRPRLVPSHPWGRKSDGVGEGGVAEGKVLSQCKNVVHL